jgi:hypothetical protein
MARCLVMLAAVALGWVGCSGGDMAGGPMDTGNVGPENPTSPDAAAAREGAKVRSFFPETLLSAPFIETDGRGEASLEIELADSITTWRATAVANSLDGKYGAATFGIRVFQPFFVDLNLPVEVTRGDVLEAPIVVYNFEDDPCTVHLDLEAEEGLRIAGPASLNVELEGREVRAVKVSVEAASVGSFMLTASASSNGLSDAVRRPLRVVPDGKRVEVVQSGVLNVSHEVQVDFPAGAVEGSEKLLVKLYPAKPSMNSEGAENILNHPSGCFEQTTASSWPNVMAMAMLQSDPHADPQVVEKARAFVNEGYQRILTFQHASGGFSWWGGSDTPGLAVTALGLMQLVDTAAVHPVDESAIERAARWLAGKQESDGSFEADTHLHCGNMSIGESTLRMTAYVAWALAHAGLEHEAVGGAALYLKSHAHEIEDAYTLSLVVMALEASGLEPELRETLTDELRSRQVDDGSIASDLPTMYYSYGDQGMAENTAVGGLALMAGGIFPGALDAAGWVAEHRQGSWGYGSTQTTVQSLRLLNSISLGPPVESDITVSVAYDGAHFASETISPENADVVRQFDLSNLVTGGTHTVEIAAGTESGIQFEVIAVHHLPWSAVGAPASHLELDVDYDRTFLRVGETVSVRALISATQSDNMPLAEIGLPPGFAVQLDLLDAAKEDGVITRYEIKNGKLALYFDAVLVDRPVTVQFELKAGLAVEGLVPASAVYPYYNPSLRFETPSFPIRVEG